MGDLARRSPISIVEGPVPFIMDAHFDCGGPRSVYDGRPFRLRWKMLLNIKNQKNCSNCCTRPKFFFNLQLFWRVRYVESPTVYLLKRPAMVIRRIYHTTDLSEREFTNQLYQQTDL